MCSSKSSGTTVVDRVRNRRKATTLLEVLVVASVVGVLLAILLPAVQSARRSAQRNECANRMRQIGVAFDLYHASHLCFPAVNPAAETVNGRPAGGPAASVFARILPEIGRSSLHDDLNFSVPYLYRTNMVPETNRTVSNQMVAEFICPSDGVRPQGSSAVASFRVSIGPGTGIFADSSGAGAFEWLRFVRAADFADGLSHTVAMSEGLVGAGAGRGFDLRRDVWFTISGNLPTDASAVSAFCADYSSPYATFSEVGCRWINGGFECTVLNLSATPNPPFPACGNTSGYLEAGASRGCFPARSEHAGGVNCLRMDGSVHWASDSIATSVWHALATRAASDVDDGQ